MGKTQLNKRSAVAEMGDRGHNRHRPKTGAAVPLLRGELGPHLTQCGLGWGLLPYQVASSSIQPYGHNRHEPKTGGCAPFTEGQGGAATPSNRTPPGLRFTSIPSGILIHPAVWPQQTWAKNWVGGCALFSGGAGSPSNTKLPGPRRTSIPSGILIHTVVWPQYTSMGQKLGEGELCPHLTQSRLS